jgi:hypothetical protein
MGLKAQEAFSVLTEDRPKESQIAAMGIRLGIEPLYQLPPK